MTFSKTNLDDLLPLPQPILHIMVVLLNDEQHGYGIMKEVQAMTDGKVKLGTATLYRNIRNMLEQGLIEEVEPTSNTLSSDERRRYYQLTNIGTRVIQAEINRLENLTHIARMKIAFSENSV